MASNPNNEVASIELNPLEWTRIEECLVAKQNLLFDLGNKLINRAMPEGGRVYLSEAAELEIILKKLHPTSTDQHNVTNQ